MNLAPGPYLYITYDKATSMYAMVGRHGTHAPIVRFFTLRGFEALGRGNRKDVRRIPLAVALELGRFVPLVPIDNRRNDFAYEGRVIDSNRIQIVQIGGDGIIQLRVEQHDDGSYFACGDQCGHEVLRDSDKRVRGLRTEQHDHEHASGRPANGSDAADKLEDCSRGRQPDRPFLEVQSRLRDTS